MTTIDYDFTGTDDDPWDADVFPVVRLILGHDTVNTIAYLDGNQGVMQTGGEGLGFGDRHGIAAITGETYTDTEVIVKLDPTFGSFPGIGYLVSGTVDTGNIVTGYELQYWGDDDKNEFNVLNNATGFVVSYAHGLTSIDHSEPYWWHIYIHGGRHRVRWWPESGTEPSFWYMDFTDTAFTDPGRVYLSLINQGLGDPSSMIVDDFHVNEIVPTTALGIHVGTDLLTGLYIGESPVLAAYRRLNRNRGPMTVLKQYNSDTEEWDVVLVGEPGEQGEQGEQGPTGPTGSTGSTGSGLFIWGAWFGATAELPDPPDPWTGPVTQSGGVWLITAPISENAPARSDSSPARNGDAMMYDTEAEAWINVGPIRGVPGVGAGGVGIPDGGTTGQVLVKVSDDDHDVAWVTL